MSAGMIAVVTVAGLLILILIFALEVRGAVIADLRVDLKQASWDRDDADRERRRQVDEWRAKSIRAECHTRRVLAERDFWRATAVDLGYPTQPVSARDED